MARFNSDGLQKLIDEMEKMGQTSGAIAEAMVNQAVVIIKDSWQESVNEHGLIETGAMLKSIGSPQPVKRMGDILYRDVYPQGKDKSGTRNAEKAFILNYGTSRIKATHWVDEAESNADGRVMSALDAMWDQYLDSGGVVPPVNDTAGLTHKK